MCGRYASFLPAEALSRMFGTTGPLPNLEPLSAPMKNPSSSSPKSEPSLGQVVSNILGRRLADIGATFGMAVVEAGGMTAADGTSLRCSNCHALG